MEFQKIVALRGPNIWHRLPVLEAWIDLGDLKDTASNHVPGFNDRLMTWLPTMIEHRCSVGERGGFFERLRDGTYPAHIMEHVSIELQALAGYDIGYGRARETSREGLFRVALRYDDEAVGRAALETARRLCLAAIHDEPFEVAEEIGKLRHLADEVRMGPSTHTMSAAAAARGIPVRRLNEFSLVQLGHGAKQHRIHRSATDRTGAVAEAISDDKELTKAYLRAAGVPVAQGRLVTSPEDAWAAAQDIGTPIVIKPKDGNYGNAVVIGLTKRPQIEAAYLLATTCGSGVMVEQFVEGAEHRLLVVGDRLVAATRGDAAFVIGDGKQTVWELVESQLNSDPRRGDDPSAPLAKVEIVPSMLLTLEHDGYTLQSVPDKDKRVVIQRNGNLSTDVTDLVHPSVALHAVIAAQVIGLDVAGIDVIAPDISRPLEEQHGVIIEVNASPGLHMHVEPEVGKPRPAGEAIVATLFPSGDDGRIPLVSVIGREGTTEVTRLVARLLNGFSRGLGIASEQGMFVGTRRIAAGDCRHAEAARGLLLNPLVDAAVCESTIDGIVAEGLGFDRCLVAVITSMGEGVKLDLAEGDLPEKRALVFRAASDVVLPRGAVVMQAGEPLGPIIARHCPGAVVLFSADEEQPDLKAHLAAGGTAVYRRGNAIWSAIAGRAARLGCSAEEPTLAQLAAAAAGCSLGLSSEHIVAALELS